MKKEPGTTVTYHSLEATEDEPYFDLMGCSGPDGTIDFDIPADEVEVTVEPCPTNPDAMTLRFVATFDSEHGTQRAEGAFDIELPGGEGGSTAPH